MTADSRPSRSSPGDQGLSIYSPRDRATSTPRHGRKIWIDGEKAGETPLANIEIRLGVREIVFKNPQFPERKIAAPRSTPASPRPSPSTLPRTNNVPRIQWRQVPR